MFSSRPHSELRSTTLRNAKHEATRHVKKVGDNRFYIKRINI